MHAATRILATVATAVAVAAATASAQATVAASPATACGPGTAQPSCERGSRPTSRLYEGIEMTQAQQEASAAITARYRPLYGELQAERQANRLTLPVYQAQFLSLRARERAEKRKLMTPEQLPRFDANVEFLRKSDEQLMSEARKRAEDREKRASGSPRP